jgi:hypothetical protein
MIDYSARAFYCHICKRDIYGKQAFLTHWNAEHPNVSLLDPAKRKDV